jgi:hypothetical protein
VYGSMVGWGLERQTAFVLGSHALRATAQESIYCSGPEGVTIEEMTVLSLKFRRIGDFFLFCLFLINI